MTVDTSRSEEQREPHGSSVGTGHRPTVHGQTTLAGRRPAPGTDSPGGAQRLTAQPAPARRGEPSRERPETAAAAPDAGTGVADRLADAVAERFRMPAAEDPAPRMRRVVGVCAWAAALGLGGVTVAVRALVGLMTIGASWYGPTVVAIGLLGLLCTVGAFASVHRRRLPWVMLSAATVALLAGWILTDAAR